MQFTTFQGTRKEKEKNHPGGKAAFPPACAISAFFGLHGQERIKSNSDLAWGPDLTIIGSLNLNRMLKIEF
jgi:hypothetical protein